MGQAFGAFKAVPPKGLRSVALAGLMTLAQGCAILTGKPDPDVVAAQATEIENVRAQRSALQSEVDKLKAENEALTAKLAELQKKAARLAALEPPATQGKAAEGALKEGPPSASAAPVVDSPSTAPAAPVVAAPDADVSLPDAPVPVDDSPRLVQPSFASTEQIFENEAASGAIKMSSVLWGVHLASYRHPDEASAGWKKLQRENPDELGLLEPRVEKVTLEGRGHYLRLVGGGFSSREKAKALCDKLAAKGVFCRVANFGGDRLSMLDVGGSR
jgi:hypothetical protein